MPEHKSPSLLCDYHKKQHFKEKKEKVDIYFQTIKRKGTVSPLCPHSPNPYSIRMSATSWNPGEPIFQWPLLAPLRHPPLTVFSLCWSYFLSLRLALRFSVLTVNFKTHFSPWWGDEPLEKYRRRVLNSWVVTRQVFKLLPYSAVSSPPLKKVSYHWGKTDKAAVRNGTGNGSYSKRRAWLAEWDSPARAPGGNAAENYPSRADMWQTRGYLPGLSHWLEHKVLGISKLHFAAL